MIDALSQTASAGTQAASKKASVDYDAFLQLLVAEMKNQDPTKPMESSAFISQLASFSAVEQQVQGNARLDALLSANALSSAAQVVGHTISVPDEAPGRVASVTRLDGETIAKLDDGRELPLGNGWTLQVTTTP
ncbi:MAG: flagellar hook assembly protein FlgD [Pseudomonadota bacterium]